LRHRHPFPSRRDQTNLLDGFLRVSVGLEIPQDEIVPAFTLKHLADRVAADGRLNRILDIRDVELITSGSCPIHGDIQVGLADDAKQSEVLDTSDAVHDAQNLVALRLQCFQIVTVHFQSELTLDAADRFLHVVGDRLREAPAHPGNLLELVAERRDQGLLVLTKHRTPFLLWFEVDEILGVEETGRIGAVVRATHLTRCHGHFREGRQ